MNEVVFSQIDFITVIHFRDTYHFVLLDAINLRSSHHFITNFFPGILLPSMAIFLEKVPLEIRNQIYEEILVSKENAIRLRI